MNINNNNKNSSQKTLKIFFIKLISISIAILILINLVFNLLLAERLEKIDKILLLDKKGLNEIKEKISEELKSNLDKDNLIYEEDKILLYKLYQKLKKEFQDIDKSKL